MQSRHAVPAWFGVGHAWRGLYVRTRPTKHTVRHDASFPLFSGLIRNVEMAMSKADMTIARLYAELVTERGICVNASGICWWMNLHARAGCS